MNKTQPIKRSEISVAKTSLIPDSIINAVNELIKKYWSGSQASFKQDELLALVLSTDSTLTKEKIFEEHLFDFEQVFRAEGWKVIYNKPGWDETYEPYFTFK